MDKTQPVWLSIESAAVYSDSSVFTIRRWIKVGLLPATKLPSRTYRIRREDLERLLSERNHEQAAGRQNHRDRCSGLGLADTGAHVCKLNCGRSSVLNRTKAIRASMKVRWRQCALPSASSAGSNHWWSTKTACSSLGIPRLAALKLGLTEVPVVIADLPPEKARAYRIADNQTATIADWDYEKLPIELLALEDDNFDLSLLGFSAEELAKLMGQEVDEGNCDPDDVPEPPDEAVTQPGICGC